MGSKISTLMLAVLAILLLISSAMAARILNEEHIEEGDSKSSLDYIFPPGWVELPPWIPRDILPSGWIKN